MDAHIRGIEELNAKFKVFERLVDPLELAKIGGTDVVRNVKTKQIAHRTGPPLPDRLTARHGGAGILGSIGYEAERVSDGAIARIGVGSDTPAAAYGRIHEFGGTVSKGGLSAFRRFTAQAAGTGAFLMPARPYLRPGLEDEAPKVFEKWHNRVREACAKAGLI